MRPVPALGELGEPLHHGELVVGDSGPSFALTPDSRVPAGGASPRRYFPVSTPDASGK